jgi:hypothetical protein
VTPLSASETTTDQIAFSQHLKGLFHPKLSQLPRIVQPGGVYKYDGPIGSSSIAL